jgi:surface antigen
MYQSVSLHSIHGCVNIISAYIDVVLLTHRLSNVICRRRGESTLLASQKQKIWQFIQGHRGLSNVVGRTVVMTTLATIVVMYIFGSPLVSASASAEHLTQTSSEHAVSMVADLAPIKGTGNYFPYGQCTWWASQRYHQLHGVYVPWTTNSDAWRWSIQAKNFHWVVSSKPTVGAIIDLQPWVQGAYGLGHVAVVEKVLPNGHVLASNMNWGGSSSVVYVNFVAGPGVTFITF